jgi:hypothetical protein
MKIITNLLKGNIPWVSPVFMFFSVIKNPPLFYILQKMHVPLSGETIPEKHRTLKDGLIFTPLDSDTDRVTYKWKPRPTVNVLYQNNSFQVTGLFGPTDELLKLKKQIHYGVFSFTFSPHRGYADSENYRQDKVLPDSQETWNLVASLVHTPVLFTDFKIFEENSIFFGNYFSSVKSNFYQYFAWKKKVTGKLILW